jgi:hypothetical protein
MFSSDMKTQKLLHNIHFPTLRNWQPGKYLITTFLTTVASNNISVFLPEEDKSVMLFLTLGAEEYEMFVIRCFGNLENHMERRSRGDVKKGWSGGRERND